MFGIQGPQKGAPKSAAAQMLSMLLPDLNVDEIMQTIEAAKTQIPEMAKRLEDRFIAVETKLDKVLAYIEAEG